MNKKAQADNILIIWSLIAFVVVFAILLGYVWKFNNNHVFERRFLVRDLSLVIEASQAGVDNLMYEYPLNFSSKRTGLQLSTSSKTNEDNIDLNISNNTVRIRNEDGTTTMYWFSNTTVYDLSYSNDKGDYFYVIKYDKNIQLIKGKEDVNTFKHSTGVCNIKEPLDFIWPVNEPEITSHFGFRKNPVTKDNELHPGVDIVSYSGDRRILAAASGKVTGMKNTCTPTNCKTWADGYGNWVEIDHGTNKEGEHFETFYGHLADVKVKVGDQVKKGDVIGIMGSTGMSTGTHLHFEIHVNKKKCNPENILTAIK